MGVNALPTVPEPCIGTNLCLAVSFPIELPAFDLGKLLSFLGPYAHLGNLEDVLGSQLQTTSALAVAAIGGMNQ